VPRPSPTRRRSDQDRRPSLRPGANPPCGLSPRPQSLSWDSGWTRDDCGDPDPRRLLALPLPRGSSGSANPGWSQSAYEHRAARALHPRFRDAPEEHSPPARLPLAPDDDQARPRLLRRAEDRVRRRTLGDDDLAVELEAGLDVLEARERGTPALAGPFRGRHPPRPPEEDPGRIPTGARTPGERETE